MYKAPVFEWTSENHIKFFPHYLRQFWSPSIRPFDEEHNSAIQKAFAKKKGQRTIGFLARSDDDMDRMCMAYLMSLKRKVYWASFDIAALIPAYFAKENILAEINEYEFALLRYHSREHGMIPKIVDNIVSSREMKGFHTFVVSTKDTDLSIDLDDPFLEMKGKFVFPKV